MKTIFFIIAIFSSQLLLAQYETPVFMNPGDNLQSIVNANPAGTLYILKSGTHRMQRIIPKSNDILIGEPGAVLNGSMILDNWIQEGAYWTHAIDPSIASGLNAGAVCLREYPQLTDSIVRYAGCRHHQGLYVDGKPLWLKTYLSELDNLPDTLEGAQVMEPFFGDWYYDADNLKVYLAFNPEGQLIETTVNFPGADYAIYSESSNADNVLVKGLQIEQYMATWGAISCLDSNNDIYWQVENNLLQYNYGRGISLSENDNALIRSNRINDNAQLGLTLRTQSTPEGVFTLMDNNELTRNNYAGFAPSWEAGATKFIISNGLIVRNNHVHNNYGQGLWADFENTNILYEGNLVDNNQGIGIFHEISGSSIIRCNRLYNNRRSKNTPIGTIDFSSSIYISNSSNTLVTNNYVRQDTAGRAIIAVQANRGASENFGPFCTDNIDVIDNDIVYSYSTPIQVVGSLLNANSFDSCGIPTNHFYDSNRYHLFNHNPIAKYYIHFDEMGVHSIKNLAEMQELGYELNGTADDNIIDAPDYPACADIPKQMLVKATLLLDCLIEEGTNEMSLPNPEDRVHFQPFSGEPWNYQGKDVCPKFYDDMVDWVLLEIREASNPDNILQQKAAILLKDGSIVDAYPSLRGVAQPGDILDGVIIYDLIPNTEYVLSIKTRQHTIATANHSTLLPNEAPYDFTNPNEVENTTDFTTINTDLIALNSISVSIAANDTEICEGENVELTATPNLIFDDAPTLSYNWNNGLSTDDVLSASPTETTSYTIELTDEFGCSSSDEIEILVQAIPDAPTISGAIEVLVDSEETYEIANPNASSTFDWEIMGGTIIQSSNNEITVNWDGMPPYELCAKEITNLGCTGEQNCLLIDIVSSTNNLILSQNIIIFPNPNSGQFSIKTTADIQLKTVTVYDSYGKSILQQNQAKVEMNSFPKGTYWVKIETNKGLLFKRVIFL